MSSCGRGPERNHKGLGNLDRRLGDLDLLRASGLEFALLDGIDFLPPVKDIPVGPDTAGQFQALGKQVEHFCLQVHFAFGKDMSGKDRVALDVVELAPTHAEIKEVVIEAYGQGVLIGGVAAADKVIAEKGAAVGVMVEIVDVFVAEARCQGRVIGGQGLVNPYDLKIDVSGGDLQIVGVFEGVLEDLIKLQGVSPGRGWTQNKRQDKQEISRKTNKESGGFVLLYTAVQISGRNSGCRCQSPWPVQLLRYIFSNQRSRA